VPGVSERKSLLPSSWHAGTSCCHCDHFLSLSGNVCVCVHFLHVIKHDIFIVCFQNIPKKCLPQEHSHSGVWLPDFFVVVKL